MKVRLALLLVGASVVLALEAAEPSSVDKGDDVDWNHYQPFDGDVGEVVSSPRPEASGEALPEGWDWRSVDGVDYTTPPRNQHIPEYCGACWAFSSTSAISDRIKIARKASWPDVQLSPQMVLNCAPGSGCRGGNSHRVYAWLHQNSGATDETCQPYTAKTASCEAFNVCRDCAHDGSCKAVNNPQKYGISEYGYVRGEEPMMREIKTRGPITCRQAVTKDFLAYKGKGIFKDTTGDVMPRHATSLVGYGKAKDGTKYWVGRNSWGTYWGESGFFKIARGINNLGIEEECSWGVPKENWSKDLVSTYARNDRLVKTEDVEGTRTVDEVAASEMAMMTTNTDQHEDSEEHNEADSETTEDDVGENSDSTDSDEEEEEDDDDEAADKPAEQHLVPSQHDDIEEPDTERDQEPFSGDKMGNADEDEVFRSNNKARGIQE